MENTQTVRNLPLVHFLFVLAALSYLTKNLSTDLEKFTGSKIFKVIDEPTYNAGQT